MTAWLPHRPDEAAVDGERTTLFLPERSRAEQRRAWRVRAAAYRARALAEIVFGDDVPTRLSGGPAGPMPEDPPGAGGFQGMVSLDVPFVDLGVHRRRERLFRAWAERDPLLSRVPLVFVFRPRPASEARQGETVE